MKVLLSIGGALCAAALTTPAHAEWYRIDTGHFTIFSDSSEADSRDFAEKLERFDGSLRTLQNMPVDAPVPRASKVVVYRFGRTSDIGALAGGRGIAGFYIPRASQPVAFTPVKDDVDYSARPTTDTKADLTPMTVLQHEYTHHFMLRNFSAAYPKWYVEGFAELNATIEQRDKGAFLVGKPANYRGPILFALQQFSVGKLLDPKFKYDDGMSVAQLYATGWLLSHYLSFSPDRTGQLATYLKAVGNGEDGLVAAKRIFGDLGKLDSDLRKYMTQRFPAIVVTPQNYHPPKMTVQKVEPALASVMAKRMRVSRGQTRADAEAMWRAFDKSAGNDSLDYQLLAAELALDAKDYAGATAAADRALALNPSSVSALVLKGRSLSENKAGDAARFVQARALFTRAHKIDGDDPSPLIGFYDAWRRQGGAMPKEATFALEDAFPLAAHDYSYRMMLTRMLLEQGRFPQAEQVIAPLAYSYDGRDPAKYTPLVVVNKLKSGDTAGALTSINEAFAKAEKDDK